MNNMREKKTHPICGILVGHIYYNIEEADSMLNVELVELTKGGAPCLEFEVNDKVVLRLHLKEALELKSVIYRLVFDYLEMIVVDVR